MQANQFPIVIAGVASGVAVAVTVLAAGLVWETASLRSQLGQTRQLGQESNQQLAGLRAQQAAAEAEAAAHRRQLASLQSDLESLRREALTDPSPEAAAQHLRARIISGGRYVGLGWVQAGGSPAADGAMNVVLDQNPAAIAGPDRPGASMAAVTTFSVAQQYPTWPYLWTTGWIGCDQPTNNWNWTPPTAGQPPPPPVTPSPGITPSTPVQSSPAVARMFPQRRVVPSVSRSPLPLPRVPAVSGSGAAGAFSRSAPTVGSRRPSATPVLARSVPGSATALPGRR